MGEQCLKGIWKGSDFEKLVDPEAMGREARKELQKLISFQDWLFDLCVFGRNWLLSCQAI